MQHSGVLGPDQILDPTSQHIFLTTSNLAHINPDPPPDDFIPQVWTLKGVPGNVENVWESTIRSPVSGLYDIIFRNPPLVSGFLQTRISESPSGERLCLLFVLAGGSPTPEARMIFDGPGKVFLPYIFASGAGGSTVGVPLTHHTARAPVRARVPSIRAFYPGHL